MTAIDKTSQHRFAYRALGVTILLMFGGSQYFLWRQVKNEPDWELWGGAYTPPAVLGPLYFLAHRSTYNALAGFALLALLLPPLFSVVAWPRWWTAILMVLAFWRGFVPAFC